MSVWHVQILKTTIWGRFSRCHVPKEDRQDFQGVTKFVWYSDDILIVGYDNNGEDHERTLYSAPDMHIQKGEPRI